jgi:N,N'-diacetyllegionaminate synthase
MVRIGGRDVGAGAPCFVIAEAGVNHNGDLALAHQLVEAAAAARADAVKFQLFRADELAAASAPKAPYQRETTGASESQLEMLRRLELDADALAEVKTAAEQSGLVFLCSAFDHGSVERLDELGVAAFKLGSGELTNGPLLADVASRGRPVILSTGASTLDDVDEAVATLRDGGASELVVLHCVTAYPAAAEDANLRALATLAEHLAVDVGYSDHTEGEEIALAAVALGACVLEKHLTLDRSLPGPDQRSSLEPGAFRALVEHVRRVESALGDGVKEPRESERANAEVVRRSIAANDDLPAGALLTAEMLTTIRPGTGIAPARLDEVVGRRLRRAVARHELLDVNDFE